MHDGIYFSYFFDYSVTIDYFLFLKELFLSIDSLQPTTCCNQYTKQLLSMWVKVQKTAAKNTNVMSSVLIRVYAGVVIGCGCKTRFLRRANVRAFLSWMRIALRALTGLQEIISNN